MEKINLAEILKDCPKGMELDCTAYEGIITLDEVTNSDSYPIRVNISYDNGKFAFATLSKYGQTSGTTFNKCVIFPKGKTTWEGFVPSYSFMDGHVVATKSGLQVFILQRVRTNISGYCYTGYDFKNNKFFDAGEWKFDRLATAEEKRKFFQAIKDNGYRWDEKTKTLEMSPKFKVGDKVKYKNTNICKCIKKYHDILNYYVTSDDNIIKLEKQNEWELVPNKFDINTLVPFESKVLVRDYPNEKWKPATWGFYNNDDKNYSTYIIESGVEYNYCIPYEGNEHLIGTINDCESYYKTWEDEN